MSNHLNGTSLVGSSTSRERIEEDYYATPEESTRALLDSVKFYGSNFLEPCCGGGHIAEVIKQYYPDAKITALYIADRGYGTTGVDFLTYSSSDKFDAIITNPPYSLAKEFIEHSLDMLADDGKIAMFLKIQFLEGIGRKTYLIEKISGMYMFSGKDRIP